MPEIRRTTDADRGALVEIYRRAFPDEDLVPLLHQLLDEGGGVVSLAAVADGAVAGHVVFTPCTIEGSEPVAWLLGPLAVAPLQQRRGIGGALIREGISRARQDGAVTVVVLGDPGYYARFGFEREDAIAPPYELPPEWDGAWQSITFDRPAEPVRGGLVVPEVWQPRELWLP